MTQKVLGLPAPTVSSEVWGSLLSITPMQGQGLGTEGAWTLALSAGVTSYAVAETPHPPHTGSYNVSKAQWGLHTPN